MTITDEEIIEKAKAHRETGLEMWMLSIYGEGGEVSVLGQVHPGDYMMAFTPMVFAVVNPSAVALVADSYGLKVPKEEGIPDIARGDLAERFAQGDPNVTEMVMVHVRRGDKTAVYHLDYTDDDGEVTWGEDDGLVPVETSGYVPEQLAKFKANIDKIPEALEPLMAAHPSDDEAVVRATALRVWIEELNRQSSVEFGLLFGVHERHSMTDRVGKLFSDEMALLDADPTSCLAPKVMTSEDAR